ncbi:MAG TPA: hypothetical protein VF406_13995 [Thermodesulfobacteriota bacterium]
MPVNEARTIFLDHVEALRREEFRRGGEYIRHVDNLATWLVSLSAGAILGVGPALSTFADLETVSRPLVVSTLAAFTLAVLSGILCRLAIRITLFWLGEMATAVDIEQRRLRLGLAQGMPNIDAQIDRLAEGKFPEFEGPERVMMVWQTRAGILGMLQSGCFFVGVLLAAILAASALPR